MTTDRTIAIIGASLAGAKAAEGARDAGFGGRIVMIGDEPHLPYERPPLSKALLRGEAEVPSTHVHPDGFYEQHGIELVTDHVTSLDTTAHRIECAETEPITYDAAVLAMGAAPRRLTIPGADLLGVHYLRTVDDALQLRAAVDKATRVAVVGAGWIGSEVAASIRSMGNEVVLIDHSPSPLQRPFGQEIGRVFRRLHEDHSVTLRLESGVSALRGAVAVEAVVLDDGQVEPADLVVAGIGVTPRTELVEADGGLRFDNGIIVDEFLQTSAPGVFAAGDVANAWHPRYGRHIRLEHWANALNQGLVAGRNAAGGHEAYDRLPYFYSDQYDLGLEYVGDHRAGDELLIRGDLEARTFIAFWHHDDVLTAAMNVNVWDVVEDLKAMIASCEPVDVARLVDPSVPLPGPTAAVA
jgi:3-phenylpropionate/trans-cinnamate dioxygenase ferredoxin reductase subunit